MFDNLFLSSVKRPRYIDVSDVKDRNFTNSLQENFKPKKEKEIRFFNDKSLKSVYDKSSKFTNFLSQDTDTLTLERVVEFLNNIYLLKKLESTMVNFSNKNQAKRIVNILKLYIPDLEIKSDEDSIRKAAVTSRLNKDENVRIYFMINKAFDCYEIILIDPFHLVIPSGFKKQKSKAMMNETFQRNINNKICISSLIKND